MKASLSPKTLPLWFWLAASACVLTANTAPPATQTVTAPPAETATIAASEAPATLELPTATVAATAAAVEPWETLTLADMFGVQSINAGQVDMGGQAVRNAGARWVRLGVEWFGLAPLATTPPEEYTWGYYDAMLGVAASRDLAMIVTLGGNPEWASQWDRGVITCVGLERWTEYVNAVVTRYSAPPYNVRYWEIYNEPDGGDVQNVLGCDGNNVREVYGDHPDAYAAVLELAYD
jgi:hypothetical protein